MDIKWRKLEQVLNEFADAFIQEARDNLQENKTNASYNLYNSFEKIIDIDQNHFSVKISLADYWVFVENGRKAGKFPPVSKIKDWVEIKPISAIPDVNGRVPSVEQLTFLISRKIAKEGTEPQPFFEPAKEEVLKRFELAIELAIDEDISAFIEEQVIAKLEETFERF